MSEVYDELSKLSNNDLDKLYEDVTRYGRGVIKNGKCIPIQEVIIVNNSTPQDEGPQPTGQGE